VKYILEIIKLCAPSDIAPIKCYDKPAQSRFK
jgi:hypothetical protein